MQRHFGGDLWQRFHEQVGVSHAFFDRAKGVLDRFAARAHGLRVFIKASLYVFKNVLMFPAGDTALNTGGALVLDRTGSAGIGPVTAQRQPLFLICIIVFESFPAGQI